MKKILATVLLTATLFSCKKDDDNTPPPYVMAGTWEGKLGSGAIPDGYFKIVLKNDHTLERYGSSLAGVGTWNLSGDKFAGSYTLTNSGTKVTLSGTLNRATNRISGDWENSGNNSGSWYAAKKTD